MNWVGGQEGGARYTEVGHRDTLPTHLATHTKHMPSPLWVLIANNSLRETHIF